MNDSVNSVQPALLALSLSQEDFNKAIRELYIQDDRGIWWTVDIGGHGLLYYDQARQSWCSAKSLDVETLYPAPPPRVDIPQASVVPALAAKSALPSSLKPIFLGLVGGLVVFFFSASISAYGWDLLGWVPQMTRVLVPQGTCSGLTSGSFEMFFCTAQTAFLALLGSCVTILVLFLLRRQLSLWVGRLIQPLPAFFRSLVPPILAALFFTMVWAGAHYNGGNSMGLLLQNRFPAVIGLFTYVTAIGHRHLQHALAGLFAWREQFSKFRLYGASIALPFVLTLLMAVVSSVALKEQIVVMVGLLTGYLLFTPRPERLTGEQAPENPREG